MIDRWEAVTLERVMDSGRTRPLVVGCQRVSSGSSEEGLAGRKTFVVKALGLPSVDEASICKELLGNVLARQFGIETPEPAIIEISAEFVAAVEDSLRREGLQIRPGFASGTEYFSRGYASPPVDTMLSPDLLCQAALLYAFDLVVQNADRVRDHPNCAVLGDKLVAYDFELAFAFVYQILSDGLPWEVSKHGFAPRHLFHSRLRLKRPINWSPSVSSVASFTDSRMREIVASLPPYWAENLEKVIRHLSATSSHKEGLRIELHRSLS